MQSKRTRKVSFYCPANLKRRCLKVSRRDWKTRIRYWRIELEGARPRPRQFALQYTGTSGKISLPDNVGTSLRTHPNFMQSASINVEPCARSKCLFLGLLILRICYCKLAFQDEVSRKAAVRVWSVISVSAGGQSCLVEGVVEVYGPSVHVNT